MILHLVDQRAQPQPLPLAEEHLATLIAELGQPGWSLNLVLVDDPTMAELNRRWYGGEGPTDVLSFSYLESADQRPADLEAGERGAGADLAVAAVDCEDEVTAGEVIFAPRFVADRCRREGWDLADEWALLLVHGTLHVLGWTHDDPDQRLAMQAAETVVLERAHRRHPMMGEEATD